MESAKQRGNEAFGRGDFAKAASHYTMALRLTAGAATAPAVLAVLYSNRSAAYCGMSYYGKAEADAQEAVRLDGSQPKYRCRLGVSSGRTWFSCHSQARSCLAFVRQEAYLGYRDSTPRGACRNSELLANAAGGGRGGRAVEGAG